STGFHRALALVYAEQMQRAVESIASGPEEWRKASTFSDFGLRLTAAEALRLRDEIFAVLQTYREHDAEDAPEDAQHFHVQIQAFRVEEHCWADGASWPPCSPPTVPPGRAAAYPGSPSPGSYSPPPAVPFGPGSSSPRRWVPTSSRRRCPAPSSTASGPAGS